MADSDPRGDAPENRPGKLYQWCGEGMRRPDGTPVTSGAHRRLERTGIFWRAVGTILVVLILAIVLYLYFNRTGQ
jgi:hypothetical protein